MFVLQAAVVKGRGGIQTAVAHYARMFDDVGVASALVFRGPAPEALRARGIDVIDAPPLLTSPIAAFAPVLPTLREEVAKRGAPDVLIVHSDLTLPGLRRLFPKACALTPCHSDNFKHKKRADLVVTLNQHQDALARAALPPSVRIAQLGNPFVEPAPAPLPDGGPVRFNFIARFIPTKDPLTMLRAGATIAGRPELRFIGAGELEAELKSEAQTLNANATFPGWVAAPFADFHRNDVLVLPSRWEGLPYLLQEALARGVPIIAADNAGNRTALGGDDYGALFPFGDAEALTVLMAAAVLDLQGLRNKAEAGRAALAATYGAAAFWRRLQRELQDCARA
jgi:glycosyltransferase involved in cell wall biosynthesis